MSHVVHGLAISVLLALVTVAAPVPVAAQSRCPAGSTGCTMDNAIPRIQQRIDEGKYAVQSTPNPYKKVYETGKTVRDCLSCGIDGVKDGGSRLVPGGASK